MTRNAESVSVAPFPVRLTSFVGRVAELRSVTVALGRHRLVLLVGPGGSGKTRLALEAARGWTGGRRWFVDLAPIEGSGVDAVLAVATDAPEAPGEAPLDATVRRIGDASALLVLDNCDQVVESCARAVDVLLRACGGLTVLATSREPLRVEGEHTWRVPPLSLPDSERALDGDAVLLFLDRAGLSPDAATRDLAQIHEICRHLDGMPLAIELAASRARVLTVADILAGLSDRFRLLTGGPRTADSRQRGLAESIDWSYRLLHGTERVLLQRLAVFRAPFTAEGARAVAAGDDIDEHDVLPLLASLVEKSFVVIDESHDAYRYRLLETIREYAVEQAEAHPERARAARDRHLRHLRDCAERVEPVFEGPELLRWLEQFETGLPDIMGAVSWATATGNADDALRLTGALWRFWYFRARADGRGIIETALAIDGGEPRWRAKALTAATLAAMARFEPDMVGFGREAVRVATTCGDPAVAARAHCWLGWAYALFDPPHAEPVLSRACELAREAGDSWCLADALNATSLVAAPDPPTSRARAEQSLSLATDNGNQVTACHARVQLAGVSLMQGRLHEAGELAANALAIAERIGDRTFTTVLRFMLTWLAVLQGDEHASAAHARAATATATASGDPASQGFAALAGALHSYASGQVVQARTTFTEALGTMTLFANGLFAPYIAELLSESARQLGDIAQAREHADQAVELADKAANTWGRSRAALARGRVDLYDGEVLAAAAGAHRALNLARGNEDALSTIDALELLVSIAARRGSAEAATRLLGAAAAERARIGYAKDQLRAAGVETLVSDLQQVLGAAAFARTWAEGEQLPLEDAVALARSRRGSRGRPATGWDALTPAELRVVELVGEGLNNIQIAERLFVTRDTVKGHVAAAFRKLGVSNRVELAAEATRRTRS